uniref:(northern house mosquito) hypothetical protein n=1 Tax=Culex pipiens TaxID=7175 RepID=A0A8D8B4T1_CULPI
MAVITFSNLTRWACCSLRTVLPFLRSGASAHLRPHPQEGRLRQRPGPYANVHTCSSHVATPTMDNMSRFVLCVVVLMFFLNSIVLTFPLPCFNNVLDSGILVSFNVYVSVSSLVFISLII